MTLKWLTHFWSTRLRSGRRSVILSIDPQRRPNRGTTAKLVDLTIQNPNTIIGAWQLRVSGLPNYSGIPLFDLAIQLFPRGLYGLRYYRREKPLFENTKLVARNI